MKISFSTLPGNLNLDVGYGVAGYGMVTALQRLGHQVPYQDPTASVQIHFSQPEWYEFDNPKQYKIGYTPWESTKLQDGWVDDMNSVDEIWTASDIVAKWFKDDGVEVPISVYEHGLPKEWIPKRRRPQSKLKFLHHGDPAPRKSGQMAFEAFREAFGDQDDVQLTIKSHGPSVIRAYNGRYAPGKGFYGDGMLHQFNNVKLITKPMEEPELIALYHEHHCLVYPSWGEGFGLIPQQALGTGMPTICTEAWAPYRQFLLPELALKSRLVDSPWPEVHPGQMFEPDYDSLVQTYRDVYNNYNSLAGRAFKNSFAVHEHYDWDRLTKNAFEKIVKKFG